MNSVLFPGLDSLVGLARHGVDVKPTLLRVLTDLYVQKPTHSDDEERQYVELALRLIDAVDPDTRAAVMRRLSTYANAPQDILNRLATEPPTLTAASEPGPRTAPRSAPHPTSTTGETFTAAEAATLTEHFFAADAEERQRLLARLDARGPLDLDAVPMAPADISRRLEASALAGRPSDFIRELEHALGVTRSLAETIVNDRSGEPLVVAAKVLAIPIAVLQRILLFVNPSIGHSVRRVYALTSMFDSISLAGALRMVAAWRQTAAPIRKPASLRAAAQPSSDGAPRSAAAAPAARGSANLVARNRDFAAPSPAARPLSAHDTIKKMAT